MSEIEDLQLRQIIGMIKFKQLMLVLGVLSGICSSIFWLGLQWGKFSLEKSSTSTIQELNNTIKGQKEKWSKLEPHLFIKNKFDLRKNIVPQYFRDFPDNTIEFQDGIHAGNNIPGLRYEYKEDISPFIDSLGFKNCGEHLKKLTKIHTWKGNEIYKFHPSFILGETITPSISLERINKHRLYNKISEYFQCLLKNAIQKDTKLYESLSKLTNNTNIEPETALIPQKDSKLPKPAQQTTKYESSDTNFLKKLTEIAQDLQHRDLIGIVHSFLDIGNIALTINSPELRWESSQVQKDDRALYATYIYSYHDAPLLNGDEKKRSNNLSIHTQFIIIESYQSIYFIQIFSPSIGESFNHDFNALVGEWISTLRLVES